MERTRNAMASEDEEDFVDIVKLFEKTLRADAEALEESLGNTLGYQGTATFSDIPVELLPLIVNPLNLKDRARAMRINKAMKDTVKTATFEMFGDGTITISAFQTPDKLPIQKIKKSGNKRHRFMKTTGIFLHISFGGMIVLKKLEEVDEFRKFCKLFGKLYLKGLILNNVDPDKQCFRKVFTFVDSCIYDYLTIRFDSSVPAMEKTERIRQLMDRALFNASLETNTELIVRAHCACRLVTKSALAAFMIGPCLHHPRCSSAMAEFILNRDLTLPEIQEMCAAFPELEEVHCKKVRSTRKLFAEMRDILQSYFFVEPRPLIT